MASPVLLEKIEHYFSDTKGGDSLVLTTEIYDNGDREPNGGSVYLNQVLTLHSYANSASFTLCGYPLTPDSLRACADLIESAMKKDRFI
jgi:hypothetical protein